MFFHHPLPMWVCDLETLAFLEVNAAAVEKYGYSRDEFLKMTLRDIHPSQDGTHLLDNIAKLRSELEQPGESRHALRNGRIIDVEVTSQTLSYHGRKASLVIGRDITERKRAEEALQESKRRLSSIYDTVGDVIFHLTVEANGSYRFSSVNQAFCNLTGLGAHMVVGKLVNEVIPEPSLSLALEKYRQAIEENSNLRWEERSEYPTGRLIGEVSIAPVFDDSKTCVGLVGSMHDITRRKRGEEALRQSELRYKHLLESVTAYTYTVEIQNGSPLSTVHGSGCEKVTGYTPSDYSSNPRLWLEMVPLNDRHIVEHYADPLCEGIDIPALEHRILHKNGQVVWVRNTYVLKYDDNGKVAGYDGLISDITERKRAEEVVRDSEERFRMVFEHVFDGISIYSEDPDPSRRILVECNDRYAVMAGRSREELLRIGNTQGLQKTIEDSANSKRLESLNQGTAYAGSFSWIRPDGKENVIEYVGMPITWRGKSLSIGIDRDITERRMAEEHIKQSEEQFRLIAENVADMIAVLDLDGKRIYNSPSYESILGDPESLKGTDGFQEIHPQDRERVKQVFQETVRTGIGQRLEYRFLLEDGTVRSIDSKGSVIRDSDGRISQVIVVSRDVTEEKRLAAQFLRAQRMESIGTLAGGIAHDLNNVLAPIMMAIEVLRSKIADPGGQYILNTIETSAKRGADIVRQVLAFGRGVEGDRILVQLKHIVIEVVRIAGQTFPKSIDIRTDIPRDLWTVSADPTQMHQVLLNMLVNARDAMPNGGALTISAENTTLDESYSRMHLEAKPGTYVSLAIADSGTGIPADIREKIFEPFFTTKEIGMGTGLGLSTTLAIVRSHKGFINVYSEVGKGTTFRIYIPATGTGSGAAAAGDQADLPTGKGELILIIDDEAAIREITSETLQAYGYKAMTASDGAEGVALFAENKGRIKVVITDIMMPVMDGTAAILALKKMNPDVKIIAASGLTTRGQIKTPSNYNVQAFLTKPYTAEKLLRALATVLLGTSV
jgi:PAS domain S-box-containing protein